MDEESKGDSVTIEMSDLNPPGHPAGEHSERVEQTTENEHLDQGEPSDEKETRGGEEKQGERVILSEEDKEVFKAVANGDLAELKRLAEKLSDKLPAKNEEGNPLMHYAVKAGRIDMVAFLLEKQTDITSCTNESGTAPLQLAAFSGLNEIVEMLLHYGANINHQDKSGNTALHFACQFSQPATALMLINAFAKLDLVNSIGDIPLHGACRQGMAPIVTKMCELGCPINNANGHGDTPLHLASKTGSCEAVRTLMLHGANLNAIDKDGKTAEALAKDPEVLKLFSLYNQIMLSSSQNKKFEMRKQLMASDKPMSRMKLAVLGHSGVGKTTFVESLKCGFLKSFIWSSYYTISKAAKGPRESANTLNYTKGVVLHNANLTDVGDVTIYDYSGSETYRSQYSLFLGDSSTVHVIVVSMNDPEETRSKQIHFWLDFIRIRMMPKEPIGFAGCNMWAPNVYVVMTNADENNSTKNSRGVWSIKDEEKFLSPLVEKFERDIIVNRPVYVLDAQLPNSTEMKEFKKTLSKLKVYMQNFLPTQMGCLEQTILELPALRAGLTSFPVVDFKTFSDFVRTRVNLLASDDVVRELTVQLQLMGEIICYGINPDEVLVLSPAWLGTEIVGKLFSPDTIQQYKTWSGFVSESYLRHLFQRFDFAKIMNLLRALNICYERQLDSNSNSSNPRDFYLHSFNRLDFSADCKDWPECRKSAAIRGAVRLSSEDQMRDQLGYIFPHVINALRVVFTEKRCDFSQWKNACRIIEDNRAAVVTYDDERGHVTVACHSSVDDGSRLFAFSETICAVVYNSVDEQCPGIFLRRMPASWSDCRESVQCPRFYEPSTILTAQLAALNSDVRPDESSSPERLVDVLAFGSEKAFEKFIVSTEAHVSCLSYLGRCRLAWLLDKNLEVCRRLAEILKVDVQSVPIESGSVSVFDRMLTFWSGDASITLRKFHDALRECDGTDDVVKVLLDVAPVFVYLPNVTVLDEEVDPPPSVE